MQARGVAGAPTPRDARVWTTPIVRRGDHRGRPGRFRCDALVGRGVLSAGQSARSLHQARGNSTGARLERLRRPCQQCSTACSRVVSTKGALRRGREPPTDSPPPGARAEARAASTTTSTTATDGDDMDHSQDPAATATTTTTATRTAAAAADRQQARPRYRVTSCIRCLCRRRRLRSGGGDAHPAGARLVVVVVLLLLLVIVVAPIAVRSGRSSPFRRLIEPGPGT